MGRGRGRPPKRVPDLCRRKDGRLYVTDPATGQQIRLKDETEYEEWRRKFLERNPERPVQAKPMPAGGQQTVAQLCDAFLDHAESYYVKDGEPTGYQNIVRLAIREWLKLMADEAVNTMRPAHAEKLQEQMIGQGMARTTINALLSCLRVMLRWGVRKELIDPAVLERVRSVPALRKGRSAAREPEKIQPVELSFLEALEPELSPTLKAMVWVQYYTGMRPGEACRLCALDLDTSGELWEYLPARWKTEHHDGEPRRIFLGRRAQDILRPFLEKSKDPNCPLFRTAKQFYYTTPRYRAVIRAACQRAGIRPFGPNRLRHAMATAVRKEFGIEAAQVYLGHSHIKTTEVYALRNLELAKKVAAAMG